MRSCRSFSLRHIFRAVANNPHGSAGILHDTNWQGEKKTMPVALCGRPDRELRAGRCRNARANVDEGGAPEDVIGEASDVDGAGFPTPT